MSPAVSVEERCRAVDIGAEVLATGGRAAQTFPGCRRHTRIVACRRGVAREPDRQFQLLPVVYGSRDDIRTKNSEFHYGNGDGNGRKKER